MSNENCTWKDWDQGGDSDSKLRPPPFHLQTCLLRWTRILPEYQENISILLTDKDRLFLLSCCHHSLFVDAMERWRQRGDTPFVKKATSRYLLSPWHAGRLRCFIYLFIYYNIYIPHNFNHLNQRRQVDGGRKWQLTIWCNSEFLADVWSKIQIMFLRRVEPSPIWQVMQC